VYVRPDDAKALAAVVTALAEPPPDRPLASLPYHPLLNFLAARPGVTRFYLVWPVERDEHRDEKVVQRLESNPEADVVYTTNQYPVFPRFAAYAPMLFRFLVDHYAVDRTFGGDAGGLTFLLLHRKEPPAGRSLLGDVLSSAQVTVEPRGQPAQVVGGGDRDAIVGEALWPFERVLEVASLPAARVSVGYRVTPASGDHFEASYGVNPEHLTDFALPDLRFTVAVRDADEMREVMDAEVSPVAARLDGRMREIRDSGKVAGVSDQDT
jgi:hypothetical protein